MKGIIKAGSPGRRYPMEWLGPARDAQREDELESIYADAE